MTLPTEREKGLMLVAIVDCMAGLTGLRPPAEREQIPQEMRPHIDRLMFEMWRIATSARPEVARITEAEAARFLDDGFAVKVLNAAPESGHNGGKNYWRCPHCGMADFDGHEQSCVIRMLVERLLGRHIPFGEPSAVSPQLLSCQECKCGNRLNGRIVHAAHCSKRAPGSAP